ncbi:MAG TPA: DMT family transporter [Bacteroidales bacterium]|nr:DMT family transporter [Bacteroidales bacterium]
MKDFRTIIYLQVFLAVVFWGGSYVWTKALFEYYGPLTIMFFRLGISSVLVFGLFRKKMQKVNPKDYLSFLLLSFFSPFCYFLGESFGLLHVSPIVAAVMIATIPLFSPLLGILAFREKISLANILGFLVSFSGVLIMVFDSGFRFAASPLGLGLLLLAVLSALVNIVFLKKLTNSYSSFTIISTQNFLGAIFFLPLFLIFDMKMALTIVPSAEAIGALLSLAVFGSTLAFMFYTSGVRVLGIARTSIFTNLIPVVTAVFSVIILGENLTADKLLGMGVVISGLLLTQITQKNFRKA